MHNEGDIIPRFLQRPNRSFFLFGRRGTGKSTWLQQVLSDAFRLDLLEASLFPELSRGPHRLEALAGGRPQGHCVVLDEIQKAPALLDEVHRPMESRWWRLGLCGSPPQRKRTRPRISALRSARLTSWSIDFTASPKNKSPSWKGNHNGPSC
jgi:hypothetical protein